MPINIVISDRVKSWFFKAVVTAAGAAVIGFLSWLIGTHISMMHTLAEQKTEIANMEDSNSAQWRIIADLQTKVATLDKNSGVVQTIQTELVLPHFLNRVNKGIEPYTPFKNIEEPSVDFPSLPSIPDPTPRPEPPSDNSGSNPFENIEDNNPITEEELKNYDIEQRNIQRVR